MSVLSSRMRQAIIRAAQRELTLKLGDKPIEDPQIFGTCYDVEIEGTYLGWTSQAGKEEAQALYAATPSRLRPADWRYIVQPNKLSSQVGLALKQCKLLEAEFLTSQNQNVIQSIGALRQSLEILFEAVAD